MTTSVPEESLLSQLFAPYALLRGQRNLVLVLATQAISRVIQWLYVITLAILAYEISHSPGVVALMTLMRIIPNAAMLPLSGVLIDRFDARRLMMVSVAGRAVCMLPLVAVHSTDTLWIAYASLFAASVFAAVFQPALMTLLPSVIDDRHLLEATSLVTQVEFLSQGIGPLIGGLFILLGDIHLVFVASSTSFVVAFFLLALVRADSHSSQQLDEDASWLNRTLGGFLFLLREHDHVLVALSVSLAGIGVINGANYTLIVFLSERTFHFGAQGADFLNAVYGLGSLLGGLVVGPLVARRSITPIYLGMGVADCLASIAFGFSPANALPFFFMALGGLTDTATKVLAVSVIQIAAPRALYGRVFSAFESGLLAAQAFGGIVVGPLVVLYGPRFATFWLSAVGLVGLAITLPWLLRMERAYGVRIFLRNVPVLARLAATVLDDLAHRFTEERFPPGATIVKEGEPGDRFYIVKQGRVDVVAKGQSAEPAHLASLTRRDYFGEIALLEDVPRTATVRADGPVQLYALTRVDFQGLLAESDAFRHTIHGIASARETDLRTKLLAGA